jgi:hypothetical protein
MLSGLFGNASEINRQELEQEFRPILADGEQIEQAFRLVRDLYVFTNRRLILVDKQGLTGSKVEYHSIPYRSITHFAVETAGHFDRDSELKLWISGNPIPIQREFRKGANIIGGLPCEGSAATCCPLARLPHGTKRHTHCPWAGG